jgi:formylglycine-generating enzyme required for sulfatase activity
VPPGFLYVPEGRFSFGFSGDEDVRRGFFGAAPLHEVRMGAFLIGQHEVTFADWLVYLRALPPRERALRMPRALSYRNALELRQRPDGRFELMLQPTTQHYRAAEGEPIRYAARHRRAVQDWLRMPVSAISFEDAQAYAAWLSRTGRVPGARLCDEREWELAARGADARTFPGGATLEQDDANFDRTYGRSAGGFGPDEVGSHPRSRSPVGADDLAGNVWEFTTSAADAAKPILRGGSWYQGQLTARSVNREACEPTARDALVGLRLCASAERTVSDTPGPH